MSRLELAFRCMGTDARLLLADRTPGDDPSPRLRAAAARARSLLSDLEARWTRFDDGSDLAVLGRERRGEVPAHPHVRALVRAGARAGRVSQGLVDMTLGDEIVRAGYSGDWTGEPVSLGAALAAAPRRSPAAAGPAARWRELAVDEARGTVRVPAGVALDAGGLGKGLAADLVAAELAGLRYVVDLGGDALEVAVEHPLTGAVARVLWLGGGGVATSGIHRRLWVGHDGRPAHHLLDPATGRPAWTGLLSATAVGRSALDAEVTAKIALLAGPRRARTVLAALGGVLVHEDGRVENIPPLARVAARAASLGRAA
jgi:FAD:protein FMN transferase